MNNDSENIKREDFDVNLSDKIYRPLPDDIYHAKFIAIRKTTGIFNDNKNYRPTFEILKPIEHAGSTVDGLLNQDVRGIGSNLGRMLKALSGKTVHVGNLLDLIGKECLIKVQRTGAGNKITDYQPLSIIEEA